MAYFKCNKSSSGGGVKLRLIGTYTGNQTLSLSDISCSGETNVDNFIIEPETISSAWTYFDGYYIFRNYAVVVASTITKSLSSSNLSISGAVFTAYISGQRASDPSQTGSSSTTGNITYKIWHIEEN